MSPSRSSIRRSLHDPAGNHSFSGWDRFGRIIDQKWTDGAGTSTLDEYTYTRMDQRGVEHAYSYDSAGRLSDDAVTAYPTGQEPGAGSFDASVLRIGRSYDDVGRLATLTSYDAASGGNIKNQIAYSYDGWGNVTKSQQAHSGAVEPRRGSSQLSRGAPRPQTGHSARLPTSAFCILTSAFSS